MAALQRVASSVGTPVSNYRSCKGPDTVAVPEQFPVGLHVLVVDDDPICLKIVERMLLRCLYRVTMCSQATVALNLLRERKGSFDVVLSDVHMPDMDGYKLLEHVGLEMDLPVIMMSADTRTSAVMKGVRHGACDYLIKPIREEELKNLWQHVVRKKWIENKEHEHSSSLEENDRHKQGGDGVEYASSVNEATDGVVKCQKKRNNAKEEDDDDQENDDPSTSKKPRVVWSVELHQQFVSAVNQLGIDKAVPKRILELMNVPGLTRENVASHLQKFRLYLKRLSGVAQQSGISNAFCGPLDSSVKLNLLGKFDIQSLVASGQIPPQTLAALHADLLGRPIGSLVSATDQSTLLQASIQSSKCIPVEHSLAFGQPLVKCQSNVSKNFSLNIASMEEIASGFGQWPPATFGAVGPSGNLGSVNIQNSNVLMDMALQQQQQPLLQQSSAVETNCSINMQPSCLMVPSHSATLQAANSPASINQNCNRSVMIDYSLLSQSSKLGNIVPSSNANVQTTGLVSRYTGPGSVSLSMSSCSVKGETAILPVQNSNMTFKASRLLPGHGPNSRDIQASYNAMSGEVVDQGALKSLGFVGKGTCIPSRFAVDDFELLSSNLNHGKAYPDNRGNKVKQEPYTEVLDAARAGVAIFQQFPPNDLMSVFME